MKPTPREFAGKWVVDLRWAGFGQRYTLCDGGLPEVEALHVAYALLDRLRRERAAEPCAQLALGLSGADRLFADVVDGWEREKDYSTKGGEDWGRQYARSVRLELGAYSLAEFLPPDGHRRLRAYRDSLAAGGAAPNTIANRLSLVRQVLEHAVDQGWLAAAPRMPVRPAKRPPVFDWIGEEQFRILRADVFRGASWRRHPKMKSDEQWAIYVERRRCYLSWLMYTGVHTADADNTDDKFISLDVGIYRRRNSKSAHCVPDAEFPMPEPLQKDLRRLRDLLGRPFYAKELVFGGPWATVTDVLAISTGRLEMGKVVPRVLRRSFAREMFRRGHTLHEVADMMGHVDLRMLREIYLQTPRPAGAQKSLWRCGEVSIPGLAPGQAPGKVLAFQVPALPSVEETAQPLRLSGVEGSAGVVRRGGAGIEGVATVEETAAARTLQLSGVKGSAGEVSSTVQCRCRVEGSVECRH